MHLRDSGFPGSVESLILGQIPALSRVGYEFVVATFRSHGDETPFLDHLRAAHCATVVMDASAGGLLFLIREARRRHIDLIVSHDYKSNLFGFFTAKALGIPIAAVFHGRTSHDRKIRAYEAFDDRLLRFLDRVVCVSDYTKALLLSKKVPARKLATVYNAVDIERVRRSSQGGSVRRELGLQDQDRLVAAIGRVSPEKGQAVFVDAAIRLLSRVADLHFLIVGHGPDLRGLEERVNSQGHDQRIHLLGYRPDAARILAQSDLLVNASLKEGMPMVVLEAFALKVPVLCTDVGGVPEIVRAEVTGYLCPEGDAVLLSERILEVLGDGGKARIVENAYRLLEARHTFDRQATDLARVYGELAAPGHLDRPG